jgi:hypothetical protein
MISPPATNRTRRPARYVEMTIVRIVDVCTQHPWLVMALALAISVSCAVYTQRHFAIKTDINELISPQLPRRQNQFAHTCPPGDDRVDNMMAVTESSCKAGMASLGAISRGVAS